MFLATYFRGQGEEGAFYALSEDGLAWEGLPLPFLRPTRGGLVRDPFLLLEPDRWTLLWTPGWGRTVIGRSTSTDGIVWSEPQPLDVMGKFPKTLNAWAPEAVRDPATDELVIFWSSTVPGYSPETETEAGDRDSEFGGPGNVYDHRIWTLGTDGPEVLFDPGFNTIDATILPWRGRWLLIGKDETKAPVAAKWLYVAEGPSPRGPFQMRHRRITGEFWAEGPSAVDLGDRLRVYFDRYTEGRWGAVESTDLETWTDLGESLRFIPGARHGSVVRIAPEIAERIRSAFS